MTPSVIGRYRIRSVLGRGSTGVVYRAYDPQLNRHIALKVVAGALRLASRAARDRILSGAAARPARPRARDHARPPGAAGLVAAGGGTAPRVRRIDAWLAARAK